MIVVACHEFVLKHCYRNILVKVTFGKQKAVEELAYYFLKTEKI